MKPYHKNLRIKHSIRKRMNISRRPQHKQNYGKSNIYQYPYKASYTPPKKLYTINEDSSDDSSNESSRSSVRSVSSIKLQRRDSPSKFLVQPRTQTSYPTKHASKKTQKVSSRMMDSLRRTVKNISSFFGNTNK